MGAQSGSQLDPKDSGDFLASAATEVGDARRNGSGVRREMPVLLSRYQHDIRRNLRVPISVGTAENLRRLVSALLQHALEPLLDARSQGRPFSGPDRIRAFVEEAADLLDDIDEYSTLASHFFDAAVEEVRSNRPTDQVRAEVREVASMARELKGKLISYLASLEELLEQLD
jgi:hypothetical protein